MLTCYGAELEPYLMRYASLATACALALLATPTTLLAQPPAEPRFAAKLSPDELKFETALARQVELKYREKPFNDVIADLSKQIELPITLDSEGLEEADVTKDQIITMELGPIGLRQAFELLLSPLHLTCVSKASGFTITSEEEAAEHLIARIYPVDDLVRLNPAADSADKQFGCAFEPIIELITTHVSPDLWTDNGGEGSVQLGPGNCLVVRQTYEIHREVDRLILGLRKLKADQAALKQGEVGPVVDLADKKAIRDALAQRHSITLDGEFHSYLKDVAKIIDVPIVMDPEGLEESDVTPDQIIRVAYKDARIGDVLRENLAKLHLDWIMKEGYVIVTSQDKRGESTHTRLYPVADLVPLRAIQDPPVRDFDALIEFIESGATDPDQWYDNGGHSVISSWPEPAVLLIDATDETHEEIERLLTTLREAGVAEFHAELEKQDQRIAERVYTLYPVIGEKPKDNLPSAEEVAKLIRELLPDESWQEEGVLLRPFHDRLIIRQRAAMHSKVEKLLEKIGASPVSDPRQQTMGGGGFF